MRPHFLAAFTLPAMLSSPPTAAAQYAEPPPSTVVYRTTPPPPPPMGATPYLAPRSLFRLQTGPALRISEAAPEGGLFVALDVGRGAAGVRASGAWLGVGQPRGVAQYTAELWVDFALDGRLHPVLGAGAGVALVNEPDDAGALAATTVGVGVLRPGLHYVLPVRGADARAGVELLGALPAIQGADDPSVGPWLVAVATVSVGF